jgi:type IV secretory pathway VirB10-like protein
MSELSRETKTLLDLGRDGEALRPRDKARLRRVVLAQVAATSVVATTSAAAAWTAVTAKIVGVAVVVGSVAAGVVYVSPRRAEAPRPQATAVVARPATPTAPAVKKAAPPTPAREPAAPPVNPPPVATARPPEPAPSPVAAVPTMLEEETRLLHAAEDAMKAGSPDRALATLGEHAARFPDGYLARERAADRVFALCLAGRQDDARQEADAFLAVEGVGPLAERVRTSCGGQSR